jgi:hypothetical protein
MIFRAIALSLALLVGIGAVIPLATNYAEAGVKTKKHKKRNWKGVKKYSKRWWQLYRRQERLKKARHARLRSLRLHRIRLANARNAAQNNNPGQNNIAKTNRKATPADSSTAMLPSGETAPKGWKRGTTSPSELQYRVEDDKGANFGSASVSVVGPTQGDDVDNVRSKTVGGVATSSLRGTVIDKMIKESGWVVNDYQKEIGGKKVYVVVAQSPGAGGTIQSRLFYFTEVSGSIYSVATNAPVDNSRKLEEETEKVINSLQRKANPVQQAELKK